MKPNDRMELNITATAQDGRGIARTNGLVVFVFGTLEGERVIAQIYTVHKTYATAGVVEVLEPSPYRAEAFCEAVESCGGCPLAHITYKKQLEIKKQTVVDAFERLGKFDLSSVEVLDTYGMAHPFYYRNKMVFPLETKSKKTVGGFYERRSHNVVPLKRCDAGEKAASAALKTVVNFLNREGIAAYDEKTKKGSLRRVFVRTAYHTKELMIVLSSSTENIKNINSLVDAVVASRVFFARTF